jgi:probable phosphoglycerate mutase
LAGFTAVAKLDADLVEWNYGHYEGKTTAEIRKDHPEWELFRDGCPGGESVADVAARAERVVMRLRAISGNVLLFSSNHFLRMLVTRWLGLEPAAGRFFMLGTAAMSVVGYYRSINDPVIHHWNDCR